MIERNITSGMERYFKRNSSKKRGSISLTASQKENTDSASFCSPRPFILTSLRCNPALPKWFEVGAQTCLCKSASSFHANLPFDSLIVPLFCPSRGVLQLSPLFLAASTRACNLSSARCFLAALVAT